MGISVVALILTSTMVRLNKLLETGLSVWSPNTDQML